MRKLMLIGWGVLLLSLASFWNLRAQEVVAHIRGTVTDPSGAEYHRLGGFQRGQHVRARHDGQPERGRTGGSTRRQDLLLTEPHASQEK